MDRRLGARTYIAGALVLVALAGAAVALVLTLQLKRDAATKDDVSSLRDQLSTVQQSATQAAQASAQSLKGRLATLQGDVNRLASGQAADKRQLQTLRAEIRGLSSQARARGRTGGGASGAGP